MREHRAFIFRSLEDEDMWYKNKDLFDKKINEIAKHMKDPDTEFTGLTLNMYMDSADYIVMMQMCKKLQLEPIKSGFVMKYSKKELSEALYFQLYLGIYGTSDYTDSYQTEYEKITKCKFCGREKEKQVSDLYIDKLKFGKKDIATNCRKEIIISENLKNILEENNVSGISFGNVHHFNNKRIKNNPTLYQLFIGNILPKMSNKILVEKDTTYCEFCKNYGILLRSLSYYKKEDISFLEDFNLSHEYFGGGYSGVRNFIISKKVYNLFKQYKIKSVRFDIVQID